MPYAGWWEAYEQHEYMRQHGRLPRCNTNIGNRILKPTSWTFPTSSIPLWGGDLTTFPHDSASPVPEPQLAVVGSGSSKHENGVSCYQVISRAPTAVSPEGAYVRQTICNVLDGAGLYLVSAMAPGPRQRMNELLHKQLGAFVQGRTAEDRRHGWSRLCVPDTIANGANLGCESTPGMALRTYATTAQFVVTVAMRAGVPSGTQWVTEAFAARILQALIERVPSLDEQIAQRESDFDEQVVQRRLLP